MLKMLLGTSKETEKTLALFYYDPRQEEYYVLEVPNPEQLKFTGVPTDAARSFLTKAIDAPVVPHFYVFREFELDGVVYQPVQFGFYLSPEPMIQKLNSAPYVLVPRLKHPLGDAIRRANLVSW